MSAPVPLYQPPRQFATRSSVYSFKTFCRTSRRKKKYRKETSGSKHSQLYLDTTPVRGFACLLPALIYGRPSEPNGPRRIADSPIAYTQVTERPSHYTSESYAGIRSRCTVKFCRLARDGTVLLGAKGTNYRRL